EYRIEQLARAAGVAVDTIRFYQGKGLLDAPRREGRVTFYGDAHVERLKRIKELQQQGFTLTVIQRFLAGELEASDEALVAAVTRPAAPQTLTLGELAERSGVAEPLLRSLQQAGLLVPIEGGDEPLYPADDLEAIAPSAAQHGSPSGSADDHHSARPHVGTRSESRPGGSRERHQRRGSRGDADRAADARRRQRGSDRARLRHRFGAGWSRARGCRRQGDRFRIRRRTHSRGVAAVAAHGPVPRSGGRW